MAELKKCPFCGGEVRMYTEAVDAETEVYHFDCGSCYSDTYFDFCDREEAIKEWNTRATTTEAGIRASSIDEAMERLAKAICVGCGYLKDCKCTYKGSNCGVSQPMLEKTMAVLKQLKGE